MSAINRISSLLSQLPSQRLPHIHSLSPTSFLTRAAAIEPHALAICHTTADGIKIRRTYLEFANRSRGLAHFFLKHGLQRVGILAPNTPAFLETIFAIGAAGGVHVGVNYRLNQEDISYMFSFAEVDCIIVDAEYLSLLDVFKRNHPHVRLIVDTDTNPGSKGVVGLFDSAISEGLEWDAQVGNKLRDGADAHSFDEDTCIAVPFTSGTTAKPKGVVYTHRGAYLAAMANVIESGLSFEDGKRCGYLWTLPMFHAVGWKKAIEDIPTLNCIQQNNYNNNPGCCIKKVQNFWLTRLIAFPWATVTHFSAAPTVVTLLCASKDAAVLRNPIRVTVAASPPSAHLFEQMSNLNLLPNHVYGLTETYGPVTKSYYMPAWNNRPDKEKYANMARQGHGFITSLPIRVVKTNQPEGILVDVEKNGQEIGEIVFSGNICAKEYFKDPEASRKLWAGGVLHSGDLAAWHSDGSAQILDRQKDVIISGGENISSIALEAMIIQHPDVLETAVVSSPDEAWGERPIAFVTLKKRVDVKTISDQDLDSSRLVEWARKKSSISRFMIPREFVIVSELPKTSTGKVKKNILRRWAIGDYS
ncbi:long chain fatty acyl-CoA synthetase [Blumeria hordei DH14]|uniref:Long chain fatty acyl-CoA synthetase n=1 Tax=Blumeria graminis f. sp. hordei (strain DH14) TaxID=546991 RepID=N1J4P3_BLUG1|nr:long chain fatty acyl-CoA synthetase [Blumeria hordei DH14]